MEPAFQFSINDQVIKKSKNTFKSGLSIVTIKEFTINPYTNLPAATFMEDDSVVELKRLVKTVEVPAVEIKKTRSGALPSMKRFRKQCKSNICCYCEMNLNTETQTKPGRNLKNKSVDHFVPLSKGGSKDLGNLRMCCRRCNEDKDNIHPEQDADLWNLFNQFLDRKAKQNISFRFRNYLSNNYCRLEDKP